MLTGEQVAALIVAVFWAILVAFLSYVLVRLARVLSETTKLVAGVTERTVPLLDEMATTVTHVDGQLERIDAITRNVESVTDNASRMSTLVTAVFGGPMTRLAGMSYGVRQAIGPGESGSGNGAAGRRTRRDVRAMVRGRRGGRS